MVIRVRVKLKSKEDESIETSAIANSGYESYEPEIVVPEPLAKRLNLFPKLPSGTRIEEYRSIGGVTRIYYVPDAIEISVITSDRVEGPVVAGVAISDKEEEVLLSDKLIDALNVALEKPGMGLWRFVDEPPSKTRTSKRPEKW